MQQISQLPPTPRQDPPEIRGMFSSVAMTHPGRMRGVTCERALSFFFPKKDVYLLDPMGGIGTTILAASRLGFAGADIIEYNGKWTIQATALARKLTPFRSNIYLADARTVELPEKYDGIFFSPEFAQSHTQGRSQMQKGILAQKSTHAGNDFDISDACWAYSLPPGNWRKEKNFCRQFRAVLTNSIRGLRRGQSRPVIVHIKNFIKNNQEIRVDEWVAAIMEEVGLEVQGYVSAPIERRSWTQEIQRLHLRTVVNRNVETLTEVLECGHTKVRSEPPASWPVKARCVECGPIADRKEVREERFILAHRV